MRGQPEREISSKFHQKKRLIFYAPNVFRAKFFDTLNLLRVQIFTHLIFFAESNRNQLRTVNFCSAPRVNSIYEDWATSKTRGTTRS